MEKTVVELFAGVGGFRVGLNHIVSFDENGRAIENGDWKFVWANQWEPSTKIQHAFDCYCTRFGTENHSNQDISKVKSSVIPNHSLLVGGFPCQDYSVARSLSGEKGIEGKKGVLFWEIARILKAKKTPFVLLENVDRLLKSPSTQRGRDFGIMLRTFHDLGYNVEWRVINAADYGFPQRRRRVYIFAWKRNTNYNKGLSSKTNHLLFHTGLFAKTFPILEKKADDIREVSIKKADYSDTIKMTENFAARFENSGIMIEGVVYTLKTSPILNETKTLSDIIDKKTDLSDYFLNENQLSKFEELRGAKSKPRTKPDGTIYYYSEGSMSKFDSLDLPGRTMLTSEASVNRSTHIIRDKTTKQIRFITPIEAERMQMFPDNWTDTGMPLKRRYFMMGNALVTGIVSELEVIISKIINNEYSSL